MEVPIWIELPRIPVPLWTLMERVVAPLGTFIYVEKPMFYGVHPYKRFDVKIDLSKDLRDDLVVKVSNNSYYQRLVYINLPNNYYHFQLAKHKIRDFPLMEGRFKAHNEEIVALVAHAPYPLWQPHASNTNNGHNDPSRQWTTMNNKKHCNTR